MNNDQGDNKIVGSTFHGVCKASWKKLKKIALGIQI